MVIIKKIFPFREIPGFKELFLAWSTMVADVDPADGVFCGFTNVSLDTDRAHEFLLVAYEGYYVTEPTDGSPNPSIQPPTGKS